MRKKHSPLKTEQALRRMREGATLVCTHGAAGLSRFTIPAGPVGDDVADTIKRHPAVVGQRDDLFPGHHQTWRMRSFVLEQAGYAAIHELNEDEAHAAGYPNLISMQQETAGEQYPSIMYGSPTAVTDTGAAPLPF